MSSSAGSSRGLTCTLPCAVPDVRRLTAVLSEPGTTAVEHALAAVALEHARGLATAAADSATEAARTTQGTATAQAGADETAGTREPTGTSDHPGQGEDTRPNEQPGLIELPAPAEHRDPAEQPRRREQTAPSTQPRPLEPESAYAPGTLAAQLQETAPDATFAAVLAGLEPADLGDAALVEVIAGWEREAAWVAAQQARAVNELRRRRGHQRLSEYVGDEVAARLGTTRHAGEAKVAFASALDRLPAVADALAGGAVDTRKATVLTDELLALGESEAVRVGDAVLPLADELTVPQLRARIRRLAHQADPVVAQRRHAEARSCRRVELDPTRDGMAWLHALLPADQAVAIHTTLTSIADSAAPGDERPLDARRADALADVVTRWLDAGTTPDGAPLPTRQRRRPHLNVTASARSLLELDEEPAELDGYGSIPAAMARALAAGATWTPVLLDSAGQVEAVGPIRYRPSVAQTTKVLARDVTCTFPGCRAPAVRCDIDHVEPFDETRAAEGQTVDRNLQLLCRHHHRLKTHGGWRVERDDSAGATTWTSPAGHRRTRGPAHRPGAPPDVGPPDP